MIWFRHQDYQESLFIWTGWNWEEENKGPTPQFLGSTHLGDTFEEWEPLLLGRTPQFLGPTQLFPPESTEGLRIRNNLYRNLQRDLLQHLPGPSTPGRNVLDLHLGPSPFEPGPSTSVQPMQEDPGPSFSQPTYPLGFNPLQDAQDPDETIDPEGEEVLNEMLEEAIWEARQRDEARRERRRVRRDYCRYWFN